MLLVLDKKTDYLKPVKAYMMSAAQPLYSLANMPNVLADWGRDRVAGKGDLLVRTAQLEAEGLVLRAKVQKLAALTIENVRLRELLNATAQIKQRLLLAEVVAVSPNPLLHYVMLNKGADQGVFVGQAVIDANGLYGQVIEVSDKSCRVILISDQRHAVPVQVNRNGVRMIAEGTNHFNELRLPNVALTTDIIEGDILSTSGLGGVFPAGYPVARVMAIEHDPGLPFSIITTRPFAHLDRSRQVLLVFNRDTSYEG